MKMKHLLFHSALAAVAVLSAAAQTQIPPTFAMPAGSVNTNQVGFQVRPYQTDASSGGTAAWTEDQLAGLQGPNTADLSGANASGYYVVNTVVNWNVAPGASVDTFVGADSFPGIDASTVNFSEEVLTYLQFPAAGVYTLGVNSDDGFRVSAASLNPKDRFSSLIVGQFDGTRGSGDTTFAVSVTQAGIYPFRLIYWQAGGGASVSWFSVITNSSSTNFVLINDSTTAGAITAYATAKIAPPYIGTFVSGPAGFSITLQDDVTAVATGSVQVKLNGTAVTVGVSKSGSITTVNYNAPNPLAAGTTNSVSIQFSDNAQPAHNLSENLSFVVPNFTVLPPAAAVPSSAVDTTKRGFVYRVHQIDSGTYGTIGANIAHAEAQLAGLLTDPTSGLPIASTTAAGEQTDGSFALTNVINFSFNTGAEEGTFKSSNGHPDDVFPGLQGQDSANIAGEIITYLDLKAGLYTFAVSHTDGFRVTVGANPQDAFGTPLGLWDYEAITTETQFPVSVQTAGIYPIRLAWFREGTGGDNTGDAGLEFYTVNADGSKTLVNDGSSTNAVKAYWKRTGSIGTFVKYAGPSAFVSPFSDSADVGFTNVVVQISDGTTDKVDASSVTLAVDGAAITTGKVTAANGLTSFSYTPTGLQLPRTVHTAKLVYADVGGAKHTNSWSFHLLRNYVLPTALYFEDFESTSVGPNPSVPAGWQQVNFTGSEHAGFDPTDLNSDFYLGWVVIDKSFGPSKDTGVSAYSPQVLNGVAFDENVAPLLVNHYIRAESDARQNGPPGQIQYLYTKAYDLTGKTGTVIAFDSAYEQNQDSLAALEYTVDGTNYNPVLYWVQGEYDSQAPPDIYRDGLGNIDVTKTMTTSYGDVARYTDPVTKALVGGTYGFFIKAPITQALAPYIEGRWNDNGTESKRIEVYSVPLADNQKSVTFRFVQAGTSSWYWAIDNWGVYSVPSIAPQHVGPLSVASQAGKVQVTWTGAGTLQAATSVTGPWTDQAGSSPVSVTPTGAAQFYRLRQ